MQALQPLMIELELGLSNGCAPEQSHLNPPLPWAGWVRGASSVSESRETAVGTQSSPLQMFPLRPDHLQRSSLPMTPSQSLLNGLSRGPKSKNGRRDCAYIASMRCLLTLKGRVLTTALCSDSRCRLSLAW